MSYIIDTSGALDLQNPDAISPAPGTGRSRGLLNWLGNNYKDLADTAVSVACLFNPEKCPQGATVVQPPPQQPSSGPSIYIILAVVVVVAILLIVILKK